jgi:hypothetical protein
MAITNGRSVIRVSAGEKWGGSIDVIRLSVLPEVEKGGPALGYKLNQL